MASHRLAVASVGRFQRALQRSASASRFQPSRETLHPLGVLQPAADWSCRSVIGRFFGSDGNDGGGKGAASDSGTGASDGRPKDDDPFGVDFDDGSEQGGLGTTMPPKYKRDQVTGRFTGEVQREITRAEKRLLQMDPVQEEDYLTEKFEDDWERAEADGKAAEREVELGRRIREDNVGTNVFGRSPESLSHKGVLEDGESGHVDKTGVSKPLSPQEFSVFQKYAKDDFGIDVDEDDIPVEPTDGRSQLEGYADNEYLNSKWLSSDAAKFMDGKNIDDPFADLLPSDLTPSRYVNRRQAKPLPRELLHHNNIGLLRRYITPTGQIMNRMQSRLGAKDQRKIAKLIRRARSLGLLPHEGQFAVEVHGNTKEADIKENREWEEELVRRGLVIKKNRAGK